MALVWIIYLQVYAGKSLQFYKGFKFVQIGLSV